MFDELCEMIARALWYLVDERLVVYAIGVICVDKSYSAASSLVLPLLAANRVKSRLAGVRSSSRRTEEPTLP